MKRNVIYWKTLDAKRKQEVKAELGITTVSVNGESDYNGSPEKLEPYIKEGLIELRIKEYEERRIKKVCVSSNQGKLERRRKTEKSSRKRRLR